MQLGELQQHHEAFAQRGVSLIAVSVDAPEDAAPMIERMGLTMPVLSDADFRVIRSFGIENPEVTEMALHATYIVDREGRVFYRKVARRRPLSDELLDAIDFSRGTYRADRPRSPLRRQSPWKDWTLLDAVDAVLAAPPLPEDLPPPQRAQLDGVLADLVAVREDPALRKWRSFCQQHLTADNAERVLAYGRRVMWRAYVDGLAYEAKLSAVRESGRELEARAERLAAAQAAGASPEVLQSRQRELADARRTARARIDELGALQHGPRRSLWDLKSMLKAMEEMAPAASARLARFITLWCGRSE